MPRYRFPLPTVHLGRIAVDKSYQKQGLGEELLFHFLRSTCEVAERIGIFAVDVFALDEEAKKYYLGYGFLQLEDDSLHLFLPMETVRAMFNQEGEASQV